MFAGIVEETGTVARIKPTAKAIELTVRVNRCGRGLKVGDSLAVNGCCLTVARLETRGRRRLLHFDLLQETWRLTNLQFVRPRSQVNLERSLRLDGRLHGHFVTDHVDGLGRITRWERAEAGADHLLEIAAPAEIRRYLLRKGSVAVDGISLTVADVTRTGFRIWVIPHTWQMTALQERRVGDAVNLEADILGKYVERLLRRK